ncbi:MAG: isoleucine--tRNA ligase [Candidatus Dojkabacteria bacterium]|nr:isoleucine--tRNA ligase [Candidatus Dojkabacteria bacterium]
MFKKVNPKPNFFEIEQQILKWWKDENILDTSIQQRNEENTKIFYDGPITANGMPHHGHMLTFVMKDLVPRYWTMKGYRVNRSLGWDCHGLPVEWEIEKSLGFKEKKDIERYGIAEFNKLCKESVQKYINDIVKLEEMIGRLTNNWEEYSTMDPKYIESIWWSLKELYTKGLLYEDYRVVPYSTRAGTTLSNAEVSLGGYKKIVDPAITVKFKLLDDENTFILAWTTTPWTIPTNLALAVGKNIQYCKVEFNREKYIIARLLVDKVFKNIHEYSIIENYDAKDLIGKQYIPPFDYFYEKNNPIKHRIYEGFHVNTDSGTGIVHLAPYGIEDQEIFKNIGIESFDVLNEQGDFNDMIPDLAGLHYREANKIIIENLKAKKLLFSFEEYEHELPMCWRTNTPLIYKPVTSWFIAMSKLRTELVEINQQINWIPEHIKEGRFGNWLAEIKDWNISRRRYWGTPLPIWKSKNGKTLFIGSFEELAKFSTNKIDINNIDPHRPYIDEIYLEYENEIYTRIPDVLDVWYDSGAMPFARLHYPFENKEIFEKKFPADYISESIDQTRGWFYSLHAISTSLFNSNAYKNVVVTGHILAEDGTKLSKSKKNYTPPEEMIKNFGADTVRLGFISSPITYGESSIVSEKTLTIQKQEMIIPIWNIYSYIVTYANIHSYTINEDLVQNDRKFKKNEFAQYYHIPFEDLEREIDVWLITLLQKTIKNVNKYMESFEFTKAYKEIKSLIDSISKWYIRRSRERFVEGDITALDVLIYVFVDTLKLLAPFAPFLTEYIYRELVAEHTLNVPNSIHLCNYPEHSENYLVDNQKILDEMSIVKEICEMGLSIRTTNNIKLRQPLNSMRIYLNNSTVPSLSSWMTELILDELNIKTIRETLEEFDTNQQGCLINNLLGISICIDLNITEELKEEGLVREVIRYIQSKRKNMGLEISDKIQVNIIVTNHDTYRYIQKHMQDITKKTNIDILNLTVVDNTNDQVNFETQIEGIQKITVEKV